MEKRAHCSMGVSFAGVLFVACFMNPWSVSAQESEDNQTEDKSRPQLVITANRFPVSIDQVGSSVTVIDSEQIKKKGYFSVAEVLRDVPGVEIVQSSTVGSVSSIFIRGGESDHTLLLIDGVRANDNNIGAFDISNLKAENIERIEILRGPQSVLYGSEAIGGVVNIFTKKTSKGLGVSASTQGGSYGTQEHKATLGVAGETYSSSTTLSYFRTDGISAAAKNRGNSEKDFYDNLSISNGSRVQVPGGVDIDFSFRYFTANLEVDGFEFGTGAVDDLNAEQDTDTIASSAKLHKAFSDVLAATVELGVLDVDSKGSDPDTAFNNYKIDNQTQSVTTKLDYTPDVAKETDLVFSLGHVYEIRKGRNAGNFNQTRDVNSFFLENQLGFYKRLFMTLGVRTDHDSIFGDRTTFRTTLASLFSNTGSRVHASFGTGYKAPSFNELFFPNFGNPNLKPETSWGYDVGVEQKVCEHLTADVTVFQNVISDLITFNPSTFLAANIQEARVFGIESNLDFRFTDSLSANMNYTYTRSKDQATGRILPRRPRHRGTVGLVYHPVEKLSSNLSLILVNGRKDSDGTKMDNYERVDFSTSYQLTENIRPFVRVRNLFDQDYEEVSGFGTFGFSVYGGAEIAL